jgi:hypothetical protein
MFPNSNLQPAGEKSENPLLKPDMKPGDQHEKERVQNSMRQILLKEARKNLTDSSLAELNDDASKLAINFLRFKTFYEELPGSNEEAKRDWIESMMSIARRINEAASDGKLSQNLPASPEIKNSLLQKLNTLIVNKKSAQKLNQDNKSLYSSLFQKKIPLEQKADTSKGEIQKIVVCRIQKGISSRMEPREAIKGDGKRD